MSHLESQEGIASWFDQTYDRKAFAYLRPLEAYPVFLQLAGASAGEKLLDVACGPGLLLKAASLRGIQPTGIDISKRALEIGRDYVPDAELHEGNAEELPFEDGSFDVVTCIGAIERFLDRPRALREMRRVAKEDGRLCFMVRNAQTLMWTVWKRWFGMQNRAGHQDALGLEQWTELFAENGLAVERVVMDQWLRQRLRRVLRGFRPRDLTKDEAIAEPWIPLRYTNEFIFVLRKA